MSSPPLDTVGFADTITAQPGGPGRFSPANSLCALRIADEVHAAIATGRPVKIRAGGSWATAGAPVDASHEINLSADRGIVQYVPGDLTLTVLAGTTLSQIAALTAAENQWLPLDPPGSLADGTIGATVATASYGALSQAHGTPRDLLLGVEFVSGRGEIVRGGGRVTKNVAGFDLTRLLCGSWGTLGVITEVSLRLRALPEVDRTMGIPLPEGTQAVSELLRRMRVARIAPDASVSLDAATCASLSLEHTSVLLFRFCGNERGVAEQVARAQDVAESFDCDNSVWHRLREVQPAGSHAVRLSARPGQFPMLWNSANSLASSVTGARLCGYAGRGIVRLSFDDANADILKRLPAWDGFRVVPEHLPPTGWSHFPTDRERQVLAVRIRDAFDPQRLLNRGILGGDAT